MLYYPSTHPYFHDDHPVITDGNRPVMLDEISAHDILHVIDPRDLPHRDYAPLIKYVRYVGIKSNIMKFIVPSPTNINHWDFYIQFVQWKDQMRDTTITPVEAARLLYWSGDVRVHCKCPSFLYWGYEYILTGLDAAIRPEIRPPRIRNPNLKGILCKHGRRVFKTLGFHLGDIASAIKMQREHID